MSNISYINGEYVVYDNGDCKKVYKCVSAFVFGSTFDANNWYQIPV